jgi:hypothetical protein
MYAAQIQTGHLRASDLPNSWGGWTDYARFALTFAPRDGDQCRELASDALNRWQSTGELPRKLEARNLFLASGQRAIRDASTSLSLTRP